MRVLFADGWNSAAHLVLGVIAGAMSPVLGASIFFIYQMTQEDQTNTPIDLLEFAIGWAGARRL